MNLLPKSAKDFGSVDYWEKFFQQRGKKAFEWYGTYLELCGVLHKYIKPREKVRSAARQPLVTVILHVVALVGPALSEFRTSFWLKDGLK
jgi:hypothetical protein